MHEDRDRKPNEQDELAGAFVETAFTNDEIERAIADEVRLGIRDAPCPFLEGDAR